MVYSKKNLLKIGPKASIDQAPYISSPHLSSNFQAYLSNCLFDQHVSSTVIFWKCLKSVCSKLAQKSRFNFQYSLCHWMLL